VYLVQSLSQVSQVARPEIAERSYSFVIPMYDICVENLTSSCVLTLQELQDTMSEVLPT
jgi:hypothetical protein